MPPLRRRFRLSKAPPRALTLLSAAAMLISRHVDGERAMRRYARVRMRSGAQYSSSR